MLGRLFGIKFSFTDVIAILHQFSTLETHQVAFHNSAPMLGKIPCHGVIHIIHKGKKVESFMHNVYFVDRMCISMLFFFCCVVCEFIAH